MMSIDQHRREKRSYAHEDDENRDETAQ